MPERMTSPAAPQHARLEKLADRPRYQRTPASRGLAAGGATDASPAPRVTRDGGDYAAGLIRGVSLCTRGEALGHYRWLDSEFIASVADGSASSGNGVKGRFTHPSLSGDGLGTFLGRTKAARLDDRGERVLGDLHFSRAAHRSPDGDLASYVMDLAEGDPEAFGTSIVYEPDFEAEVDFALEHGAEEKEDEFGPYISLKNFRSPDPDNTKNMPHARLKALRACDVVDEPAANPAGLFHREQQFAQEAEGLMSYALGLSPAAPALTALGSNVHPDRVKGFVARFLDEHELTIISKEKAMSTPTETPAVDATQPQGGAGQSATAEPTTDAEQPASGSQQAAGGEPAPAPTAGDPPKLSDGRAECQRFLEAFGPAGGTWFAEGLSFETAQAKHAETLTAENEALRKRLADAGAAAGEETPLAFQPAAGRPSDNGLGEKLGKVLPKGLAAFAAGIKLPTREKKN
jgi:hypothetical protein